METAVQGHYGSLGPRGQNIKKGGKEYGRKRNKNMGGEGEKGGKKEVRDD